MINRLHRFHGRSSLGGVFRRGKSVRGEFISLRFLPTDRDDYRLAVVVSKKVSKSAVVRNRIRRRLFEIVRLYHKSSARKLPYDMTLSVFDERVATMPHDQLQKSVENLLKKANI